MKTNKLTLALLFIASGASVNALYNETAADMKSTSAQRDVALPSSNVNVAANQDQAFRTNVGLQDTTMYKEKTAYDPALSSRVNPTDVTYPRSRAYVDTNISTAKQYVQDFSNYIKDDTYYNKDENKGWFSWFWGEIKDYAEKQYNYYKKYDNTMNKPEDTSKKTSAY